MWIVGFAPIKLGLTGYKTAGFSIDLPKGWYSIQWWGRNGSRSGKINGKFCFENLRLCHERHNL